MRTVLLLAVTVLAAGWAAVLALAEESPHVARTVSEGARSGVSRYGALHVSRLALLVTAGVGAGLATHWWDGSPRHQLLVAGVAVAFVFMVAEALPRAVSLLAPGLAGAVASTAERSTAVFQPLLALVRVTERATRAVLPARRREPSAVQSARRDLLMGVFSLGESTVAEIMTPRLDITAIPADADWSELSEVVRRSDHVRIPVYRDTLDHIVGVLHVKDLVTMTVDGPPTDRGWADLVRPVAFVPETKSCAAQLRDFQRGLPLAVVVDEYGGTSGLVSLEDVLEEVVGEIHDESDPAVRPAIEREGSDEFWVDGAVTLDELNAVLETNFAGADVSTVGGLVYAHLGRVPNPGDEFEAEGFRVVVEQMARRRVRRVYFARGHVSETSEEASP